MEHANQVDDQLFRIRHSLAHVLAQAVLDMRPGSTLGFGPAIADGFYYDFILSAPLTEDDFPELEKRMKRIIKQGQAFEREDLDREQALARLTQMNEPYKLEHAKKLLDTKGMGGLSFFRNGPFMDMCEGPHVKNTRAIPLGAFKLRSLAGAYWLGDSRNVQMTRIYAWAFPSKEELEEHVRRYKEAMARDHKKLGKQLEIYHLDDDIGKGLPLWLPNGTVLRDELEKLAKELEFKAGYQRVATPHITKQELYYITGHLPYYAEHIYPAMEIREGGYGEEEVKETYFLKPMNCPHHHKIFASRKRSYRELPYRLAEYGTVYRMEDSGALSGLLRVRCMTMNDAHIYCTEDQITSEFVAVMEMHKAVYKLLNLSNYYMRFSTWDPHDEKGKQKFIDNADAWARTQDLVKRAMLESGIDFEIGKGEAAFYGPKIDVQFRSVTGREETASTNQLDFAVPQRMGLEYFSADNKPCQPYIIHRAPLGTHERFIAFLIEHFGGAFPTWLAPVQARFVTVADRFNDYAEKIIAELRDDMIRAELDYSQDTIPKKIRNGVTQKIPNILVIGEREVADQTVTWRRYGMQEQTTMSVDSFKQQLKQAIIERRLHINL